MFKVQIRKTCKICGKKLGYRQRTYCSKKCAYKFYNKKYRKYQSDWQRRLHDLLASEPDKNKIQCQICGRWYRQVGSHIYLRHKIFARKYRKMYGFNLKKGQLPEDLRALKAFQVFDNKTVNNLKNGQKFWFTKGDKRAGRYQRQPETLEVLSKLHLWRKLSKQS